jgi:hypothetical protein
VTRDRFGVSAGVITRRGVAPVPNTCADACAHIAQFEPAVNDIPEGAGVIIDPATNRTHDPESVFVSKRSVLDRCRRGAVLTLRDRDRPRSPARTQAPRLPEFRQLPGSPEQTAGTRVAE